jgi:hypothetical protein
MATEQPIKLKLKVNNPTVTSDALRSLLRKVASHKIALTNEEAAVAAWLAEVAREMHQTANPLPNLGF